MATPIHDPKTGMVATRHQMQPKRQQTMEPLLQGTEMNITVWTTPNCVQCMMTKKQFDKLGIDYEEKPLADNPTQVELFKTQGFLSAPIITTDIKTWSGFRLDKIKSLASYLMGEKAHTK
jgi:glutaredoxin-like protein NrdH